MTTPSLPTLEQLRAALYGAAASPAGHAADLAALASMNLGVLLMKLGRFGEATQRFEETLRSASAAHHELIGARRSAYLRNGN